MGKIGVCLLLAGILSACGQQPSASGSLGSPRPSISTSPSPSETQTPAPSASATAGQPAASVLIVVHDSNPQDPSGSLSLYRTDGTRAAQFSVKAGSGVLAAAGSRIFVASGDQLKAIRRDGNVESLGSLGSSSIRWFAANPDGTGWAWSTYEDSSGTIHSAVHVGGDGLTARVVEERTAQGQTLAPISWTSRGLFVQMAPTGGHGGYFPFGRMVLWLLVEGPVHRLDPATGQVAPIPQSDGCLLGDEASDQSIICFPGGSVVRFYSASGTQTNVGLATPRFNIPAEAFCAPSEAICTVAGATGVGNGMAYPNPQPEQYGTDLVRTDGSISRFGPNGVDPAMGPQSWLPDGRLVLWRRPLAAGGAPGIYVLDRSGHGPFIPTTGEPVGYLN